jgi:LysR family nitrogen assimilation transcriptional regulator
MNLKQLEYFVRVAELGSFTKAALILNVAQAALSRQVRLLETDLHATLLLRTGRGVVLTEAGKRLFDHSVGILQLVARAREDVEESRSEPAGQIVIGLPPSMGRILTLPLVESFRRQLPRARLTIVEGLSTHIAEWIATGRVDLGLVHNPEAQAALETVPVLDEELCLVSQAARAPRRRAGRTARADARSEADVPLAELPKYPLIVPERSHTFRRLLDTQAALAGLKLDVACEASSVQSILELVRAGYGHAVLTRSAVTASGEPGAYTVRPLSQPRMTTTLCLAISAHKPATPLIKHTMRTLRELIAARAEAGDGGRGVAARGA